MTDADDTTEMRHRATDDESDRPLLNPTRRAVVRTTGAGVGAALLGSTGAMATTSASTDADLPRLEVDGNLIVTAEGETVTLRGVNIIDPKRAATHEDRDKDAVEMVEMLTDEEQGWHSDVIRVPVQPTDIVDHTQGEEPEPVAFDEDELEAYLDEYLDPVLEQCKEAGVYAIVDFHRHRPDLHWGDAEEGTINEDLQDETILFWETVAPRYADDDHIIYEMYNEPTEPGMWGSPEDDWGGAADSPRNVWDLYLEFAQPIVDEIREHTDTLTLVGSPGWTQSPEGALVEPVEGENLAYTYHIYPGHEVSQEQAWDDSSIDGQGVDAVYEEYPLFVTEFGWRDYDDDLLGGTTSEFGEAFIEWLESHEAIHWTAWCADKWWEPAMFNDDWELLGRDAGSKEDAGEYIRQAIEQEGVPEGYWDDEGETDGSDDEDETDDKDGEDETDDENGSDDDDEMGDDDGMDDEDDEMNDENGTGSDDGDSDDGDSDDGDSDDGDGDDENGTGSDDVVDSVPGFGVVSTAAGVAGGLGYALRERLEDDTE